MGMETGLGRGTPVFSVDDSYYFSPLHYLDVDCRHHGKVLMTLLPKPVKSVLLSGSLYLVERGVVSTTRHLGRELGFKRSK